MVGDRLSTDIIFGNQGGLQTLLVLTGVTKHKELNEIQQEVMKPDAYIQSLGDLAQFLN